MGVADLHAAVHQVACSLPRERTCLECVWLLCVQLCQHAIIQGAAPTESDLARPAQQVADQTCESPGNAALMQSFREAAPVRVARLKQAANAGAADRRDKNGRCRPAF